MKRIQISKANHNVIIIVDMETTRLNADKTTRQF